ncbi:hypothetical protein ACLB2K_005652 [Fragaria x ananassa]
MSRKLFSSLVGKPLRKIIPKKDYRELSKSILDYARGLPLALKILGSFLYKRDRGDWESTVAKLKKDPIDQALFKALRISYDGFDKMSKQVFLDVACFLKGYDKEHVIQILDSSFGFDTRIVISVLIEKSLLTLFDNRADMHDLIQEMGREIVRLEFEQETGQRSQLWHRDNVFHVLKKNTGTEAIRSIAICLPKVEELAWNWNPKAFSKMSKLKFLKMQNLVLCQGPKYIPDAISVLEWTSYPSKSLPTNFQPVELIEIILHQSKIDQLWHGIKYLEKLTIMDLSYSENLRMTPDFTGCSKVDILRKSVRQMRKLSKFCCSEIGMQEYEVSCHSVSPHRLSLEPPPFFEMFSIIIPGNDIPCWFKHRIMEDMVPNCSSPSSKWIGFALCVIFEENPGVLGEDNDLEAHANTASSCWKSGVSKPAGLSFDLNPVVESDHLCLFLLPSKHYLENIGFLLETTCAKRSNACLKVKGCGVRDLYKQDLKELEELNLIMNRCTRFCDNNLVLMMNRLPLSEAFSFVVSGNDIPECFETSVERNWANIDRPCNSCSSTWMGFALCVLFGAEENSGAFCEDGDLEPHLIRGILWCGDVTVDRLNRGNEVLKKRMEPGSQKEVSPQTMRRIKRAKKVSKTTQKVATCVLSGVFKVSGYFTSTMVNSKVGKKFFRHLPGEILLAGLDGFCKVCDAVEVAGKNVMSTSSTVTTELVSHKYGEEAGKAASEGLDAAGHAIGTAWTVYKIRKALNPKSAIKSSTLAKSAAKAKADEVRAAKKK